MKINESVGYIVNNDNSEVGIIGGEGIAAFINGSDLQDGSYNVIIGSKDKYKVGEGQEFNVYKGDQFVDGGVSIGQTQYSWDVIKEVVYFVWIIEGQSEYEVCLEK